MEKRLPSKLAVILHADVAGSTGLVQQDEALTHERIRSVFQRLSRIIKPHDGITHEIRGDALLAEFDRASSAVSAALEFQAENARYNAALSDDIRPVVRIGISLGEVVIADGTITGEGVVLAQRLEQLADPGGICVQGAAHDTIPKRLPFRFQSLGEQKIKGFAEPVRVYSASLKTDQATPSSETHPSESVHRDERKKTRIILAGALFLLVLIAGGLFWLDPWQWRSVTEGTDSSTPAGLEKPTIAVLPFSNLSGDPEQEFFSDGITNDIITDLAKSHDLLVIASNSVFTYKGKAVKVQQIGKELGVKYILEGSVQKADDMVRINVQLIDAATGGHLWAERYEGSLENVFALQDSVAEEVVLKIPNMVVTTNQPSLNENETKNIAAYEEFLKGWQQFRRQTPESFALAREHFDQAVALDPGYSRAHAALAAVYWRATQREWYYALRISDAKFRAEKHLKIASETPTALMYMVTAEIRMKHGEYLAARSAAVRATDMSPNDPEARNTLAEVLIYSGEPNNAFEHIEQARRLDPANQSFALYLRGLAEFGRERYEEATKDLSRALELNPEFRRPAAILAAAYGYLGQDIKARAALDIYETDYPAYGITSTVLFFPYRHEADKQRLTEGLRRAGLQVNPY